MHIEQSWLRPEQSGPREEVIASLAFKRDLCGGLLLTLVGAAAAYEGSTYDIGTLTQMGPGFFPAVLGILLTILGGFLVLGVLGASAGSTQPLQKTISPLNWRAATAIVLGVLAFIFFGKFFGLAPAAFFVVFISALGDRTATLKSAVLLAFFAATFAIFLFVYLLRVDFPVIIWPPMGVAR